VGRISRTSLFQSVTTHPGAKLKMTPSITGEDRSKREGVRNLDRREFFGMVVMQA